MSTDWGRPIVTPSSEGQPAGQLRMEDVIRNLREAAPSTADVARAADSFATSVRSAFGLPDWDDLTARLDRLRDSMRAQFAEMDRSLPATFEKAYSLTRAYGRTR